MYTVLLSMLPMLYFYHVALTPVYFECVIKDVIKR